MRQRIVWFHVFESRGSVEFSKHQVLLGASHWRWKAVIERSEGAANV